MAHGHRRAVCLGKLKHKIGFEDAQFVFADPDRIERIDKSGGGATMGTITSTVRVGEKPPKEVIKRVKKAIREARKSPPVYDPECPPSSPEALKEFAHLAAERNRRKRKKSVTIRMTPDILESYKTMGSGYTGVMADVLKYAVENPDILARATR